MIKPCTKCGITFMRAALSAMLADAGAKVYPRPDECPEGGEHDFPLVNETEAPERGQVGTLKQ